MIIYSWLIFGSFMECWCIHWWIWIAYIITWCICRDQIYIHDGIVVSIVQHWNSDNYPHSSMDFFYHSSCYFRLACVMEWVLCLPCLVLWWVTDPTSAFSRHYVHLSWKSQAVRFSAFKIKSLPIFVIETQVLYILVQKMLSFPTCIFINYFEEITTWLHKCKTTLPW